jgi:hypothetical protein
MTENDILGEFKNKVNREIDIAKEGLDRYIVLTPFMFEDGDHFPIILRKDQESNWMLTDEGHTFMHISYDEIDFDKGTRRAIIDKTLLSHGIEDSQGELTMQIKDNEYGDALFSFIQGVVKITDISFLTRERVKSTFYEDWKQLIEAKVPGDRRIFDYIDPVNDPEGNYPIDCRVNGMKRPLFVFAISNDDNCRDATITCHHFEKLKVPFIGVGIFENHEEIQRRVLSRFSDIAEKQFPTVHSAKDRFSQYFDNLKG